MDNPDFRKNPQLDPLVTLFGERVSPVGERALINTRVAAGSYTILCGRNSVDSSSSNAVVGLWAFPLHVVATKAA